MAITYFLRVCSNGHELRHLYCNGPDYWLQLWFYGDELGNWVLIAMIFHKCFMVSVGIHVLYHLSPLDQYI